MRKNPIIGGFVIAILLVLISYFIAQFLNKKKLNFIIDNPTDKSITVNIDDKVYDIKANSSKIIQLNSGRHLLNGKHYFNYNFIHQGVINPTRATYYIHKRFYGSVHKKDSIFKHTPPLQIGGRYYQFTDTVSGYFIQDFYYNLNENFPRLTHSKRIKDTLNIDARKKIFREKDFKIFYDKEQEQ